MAEPTSAPQGTDRLRRRHLPILDCVPIERGGRVGAAPERAAGPAPPAELVDAWTRRVSYLRVSLTDRCNYRCGYCMPTVEPSHLGREQVLSVDELVNIIAALRQVGVRRARLTGGEPTVRKDLIPIVARLAKLGLDELSLSSNGERLSELAAPLRDAGLSRVNISLDTLDPERFRRITRHGSLERVLAGIERVRAVGFPHTKLNTVALRSFNDDELGKICRFAFEHDLTPRFIELMPMGSGMSIESGGFLSAAEIRDRLTAEFGPILPILDEQPALPGGGPARYVGLRFGQKVRRVGLIAAVSEPFCDTCNRVRLSASGQLHACLGYDEAIDLAAIVRSRPTAPADCAQAVVAAVQAALVDKRAGHGFTQSGCGGPQKPMVSIGG